MNKCVCVRATAVVFLGKVVICYRAAYKDIYFYFNFFFKNAVPF
jgi:hypothetical protein